MLEKKIKNKISLLIITVMEFVVRYVNLLFKETGNFRV